ncbi:MAG: hypothetical protein AB8B74_14695 [Crocinitomicaceae bacterium]
MTDKLENNVRFALIGLILVTVFSLLIVLVNAIHIVFYPFDVLKQFSESELVNVAYISFIVSFILFIIHLGIRSRNGLPIKKIHQLSLLLFVILTPLGTLTYFFFKSIGMD